MKMKLDTYSIHKIRSKWIRVLNIRAQTRKLLEENLGGNFMPLDKAMMKK